MLKFSLLLLKNLGRNKIRTVLTSLAVVVLVAIYSVVSTVTAFINDIISSQASQSRLVVSERWSFPSQFPVRYVPRMVAVPGVEDWTVWHFYGGYLDESRQSDRFAFGIGTRVDNLTAMHADLDKLDPAVIAALKQERTGTLMGSEFMDKMKWSLGDRFTLISASHGGHDLEFKIVGVLPRGRWANNFFFREDYFQEAVGDKDTVNLAWIRVRDPDAAKRVAAQIENMFATSETEIKVETESAGIARFIGRSRDLLYIINSVVTILLIDMVIILSNSISITTRERRTEMAVLKVLGFQPYHIMTLVIGEAMLVGAISGLLGTGLVYSLSVINGMPNTPLRLAFFTNFPIPAKIVPWGLLIGAVVGLVGSIIPARNARRVKVSDVFAKLA